MTTPLPFAAPPEPETEPICESAPPSKCTAESSADCAAEPAADPAPTPKPTAHQLRRLRLKRRLAHRIDNAPEWFSAFLAGNHREKTRLKRELATLKGSVVWLVRQRRQGNWTSHEREHLRKIMRSASSVSPYLLIWVVPGSMLLLPFLAWFIDHRRKGGTPPDEQ